MKKLSYRIYALLIAILTCVMLTACSAGSKIYTELILNKDLSGARIMDVEIDDAVFNESFSGTIDDLNNTIINNCPEGMTYSYSEVDGIKTYRFEIAFSSPEDYQQKVRNITGQENVITINTPDTVWASGFFIDEDFTSTTLLNWLKDAIVNDGLVDASNAGNILSEGDCKVTFNGEEFSSYNEINVDTIDYLSMDSIDVLTKVSDIGQYDRTVVFTISNEVMQKKGDEIKAFFEQRVPGGANKEWTDGENGESIYTVKKTAINADGISAMNRDLFGTEVSVYTSTEILEGLSPFSFAISNEDTIDLSQYIASGNQSVRVTSLISTADNLFYGTSVDGANKLVDSWYQQSAKYPEYYEIATDYVRGGYNYSNTYVFVKKYPVKELNITTKKTLTGNYERDFEFIFDKVPTETEQEVIITRLQKPFPQEKVSKEAESTEGTEAETTEESVATDEEKEADSEKEEVKKYNIKFKNNVKKDVYTLSVSEKGSALELEEMTTLLTGNSSKVVYGEKYVFHKTKYEEVYTESIRLGDLGKDITEDFVCNYVIDLGIGSKIHTASDKEALIDGGKVTLITRSIPREVYVLSEKFNIWAVVFYIFLLGGIVLLGVAVMKSGILKSLAKPAKPAVATVETTEVTAEAPVAVAETTEAVAETTEAVAETTEVVEETTEEEAETTEAEAETTEEVAETTEVVEETTEIAVEEATESREEVQVEEDKGSFCPNCGEHRDDDALVCVKCGLRF